MSDDSLLKLRALHDLERSRDELRSMQDARNGANCRADSRSWDEEQDLWLNGCGSSQVTWYLWMRT